MMWRWKKQMIHYMRVASEESNYYQKLAEIISPYLGDEDIICDAGCGLGQLSEALSPYVKHIVAFDIHQGALDILQKNIVEKEIKNVTPKQGDIHNYTPKEKFDSIIFSMFGSAEESIAIANRCCAGKMILIMRLDRTHKFSLENLKKPASDFDKLKSLLNKNLIPYESKMFELSLDQPFKNLQEAKEFFSLYGKIDNEDKITEDFLLSRVKEQDNDQYPYLLNNSRKLGLIVLESKYLESLMKSINA